MSIDYRAVFGRSEIFSFGYIGFLLPHRSSFGAAKSAGLPTDSCFTGAVARSFSLPVLYRRKHDWKYCLNAITKQIGNSEKTINGNSINLYQAIVTINGTTVVSNQIAG